jgi:hypothetical protein
MTREDALNFIIHGVVKGSGDAAAQSIIGSQITGTQP